MSRASGARSGAGTSSRTPQRACRASSDRINLTASTAAYDPGAVAHPASRSPAPSGALLGLAFVAISFNLDAIIADEGLAGRALETLIFFAYSLGASILVLVPGLSHVALGVGGGRARRGYGDLGDQGGNLQRAGMPSRARTHSELAPGPHRPRDPHNRVRKHRHGRHDHLHGRRALLARRIDAPATAAGLPTAGSCSSRSSG